MIERLRSLFGGNDVKHTPADEAVRQVANMHADGDYYISSETVRKGDATSHRLARGVVVADVQYEPGDEIAGVLRSYEGSITDRQNIHNHVQDHGEAPIDDWTGNPSPDHLLHGIALLPGEFVQGATTAEYLAVPYWEDEVA